MLQALASRSSQKVLQLLAGETLTGQTGIEVIEAPASIGVQSVFPSPVFLSLFDWRLLGVKGEEGDSPLSVWNPAVLS